jgi:hypothetical protein
MNYTELFDTIKSYVENDFPDISFTSSTGVANGTTVTSVEQINTFIRQAEQRIYNSVQVPVMKKNSTGAFTANNEYLNLPHDFLAVYSLAVYTTPGLGDDSPQEFLLNKDVNFLRSAYPSPTETGVPKYYALFGPNSGFNIPQPYTELTLMVAPTPSQNYIVELHYFHYPPSIVDAGRSWIGENFDSVLLYGSLLEAYTYMKGESDLLAVYKQRYDEAITLYKQLGEGRERQDAYRSGQIRVPLN